MKIDKMQPIAIAAGIAVAGSIFIFSMKKKAKCERLTGIYSKDSSLNISEECQDVAFDAARKKLRELMSSGDLYTIDDIQMYVAKQLRDCSWDNRVTDEQKLVWAGIGKIVSDVNAIATSNPEEFLTSF